MFRWWLVSGPSVWQPAPKGPSVVSVVALWCRAFGMAPFPVTRPLRWWPPAPAPPPRPLPCHRARLDLMGLMGLMELVPSPGSPGEGTSGVHMGEYLTTGR
ncbi:hypothetical protein Shyhy02_23160 [Streptomyces hygroscopicus subsp. hygroscopicus]|nr:hypothetical protein Shyhy02_23160 [Streptomyces hygroscopicus subsp. hygroscopicus]